MSRVATTHVHNPGDICGYTIEATIETFGTVSQCIVNLAHKQGFIHLDISAAGIGQCPNFKIQRVSKIEGELAFGFVIGVGRGVDD